MGYIWALESTNEQTRCSELLEVKSVPTRETFKRLMCGSDFRGVELPGFPILGHGKSVLAAPPGEVGMCGCLKQLTPTMICNQYETVRSVLQAA